MKKIISFILISIIAGFCFAAVFIFFIQAFINNDPEQFNNLQGAFLGAFFAFIFVRLADGLVKISDRKSKARTAIIKSQLSFNFYLSSLHDCVYLADNLLGLINAINKQSAIPRIWTSRFTAIPIDNDFLIALDNVELINDVMRLNDDLRKINQSIETINRTYEFISSSFLANGIDIDTYAKNVSMLEPQCKEIRGFINNTIDEIIRLLAITGMLVKDDSIIGNIIKLLIINKSYPKSVLDSLDVEIDKIKSDINNNAAKSQVKINKSRQQ